MLLLLCAAARFAQAQVDAVIACDELERTPLLLARLRAMGVKLKGLWLASYGNVTGLAKALVSWKGIVACKGACALLQVAYASSSRSLHAHCCSCVRLPCP